MQICPDCQTEWSDDTNYCGNCQAKLPNAKDWMPNYKKIRSSSKSDPDEVIKLIQVSLDNRTFREYLLFKILKRAMDGLKASSADERYLGEEIFRMLVSEAKQYAGVEVKSEKDSGG